MLLYKKGGDIFIKPKNRGVFTAKAKKAGMSVQQYALMVLGNTKNFPRALVKQANFARNAAKWNK
jgi:hypothetical protein